jgi:hypothetical protein
MAYGPDTKHSLYISRPVWEELKIRSAQEHRTASEIITSLLSVFIREQPAVPHIKRYQPRLEEMPPKERASRSVYIPQPVWENTLRLAAAGNYSITGLVDDLLKCYLGLLPVGEGNGEVQVDPVRYLKVGGTTFDLGEKPIHIDLDEEQGKPE